MDKGKKCGYFCGGFSETEANLIVEVENRKVCWSFSLVNHGI